MSRVLARTVRLVKFGAVAGAVVGVGRLVLNRRRRASDAESSWPTIAETAAQNGEPIEDEPDPGSPEPASADADDGDSASEDDDAKS